MADEVTNALENPELSLDQYRTLREGKSTPVVTDASKAETPAIETAADSEPGDVEEAVNQEASKQNKKSKQDKFNGRFSELTGQIKDLQRQLAAKNGTGPSAPAPSAAPPSTSAAASPAAADVEPDPASYTDYNLFQRDQIKWEIRQADKAKAEASQRATAAQAERARERVWGEQVAAAKSARPDFEAVALNPDLPVSKVMAAAITDSDVGAHILLHLGENPDLAKKISEMSEVSAVRAIGRIEATLEKAAAAAAADESEDDTEDEADDAEPVETPRTRKPISNAPKPVKALNQGRVSTPNPSRNIEGMPLSEYRELRESGRIR